MPGNTTSVCLNSNRPWIKSALDSSAPKSLNSSKTSSTCSWIMTGGWTVQLSEYNLLLFFFFFLNSLHFLVSKVCIYSIYHKISFFSFLKIYPNILMYMFYKMITHFHMYFYICKQCLTSVVFLSGSRCLQTMNPISAVKKKLMNSTGWVKMVWKYEYETLKYVSLLSIFNL